ncbi:LysR family transcriptional regulator [Marinobacter nanhaiticus D15-8W]|uniref:LysR family transcriptional regulator n=1 Tax=Marinobacter nanhaiticus D15-8W TaxID=626887 RepID=N6WZ61_9GAMM|nr:LysR family transcriptional regulator [Marinobacter nanhaiticus]ENO14058.1 LysR family transcriptional regulator [Marinobacter nanhaiticus D15-8W]BES71439.1 LysR family transcriptional regulator [Marinobacter nanhaiticus D15-8W]
MKTDLSDLGVVVAVAKAGGFRQAARVTGSSPSRLSDAVRRMESSLGVRLFNRSTRSVVPTEAGAMLLSRLGPAMNEIETALDSLNRFRDKPSGTLKLNVPVSAAKLVLPTIVPAFLAAYPGIRLEIVAESNVVDIIAAGCDAGIRYDERLEQDMIAVPIGPPTQRSATAAAPALLDRLGRPEHPRELLEFPCLTGRFSSGTSYPWEYERGNEKVEIEPKGPLTVSIGSAVELSVHAAIAGLGVIHLFEQWLQPHIDSGALEPILEPWWQRFSGPYLYYPGHRLVPAPLRAFIDFIKAMDG